MPDIENVIHDLDEWLNDGNAIGTEIDACLVADALELLKEQQQRIEALEIDRDILVKDINLNNCNTCVRTCNYRPKPGEVVRTNCMFWIGKDGEQE